MVEQFKLYSCVIMLMLATVGYAVGQVRVNKFDPLPGDIAARVANRIVEETTFDFIPALPHTLDEGYAYLDFHDSLGFVEKGLYFARSTVLINHQRSSHILPDDDPSTARLGVSHSAADVEIKLDGVVIYRKKTTASAPPKGVDYDRFVPADYVEIPASEATERHLSIKMAPAAKGSARIWIGFFAKSGAPLTSHIKLQPPMLEKAPEFMHFMVAGPIDGKRKGLDSTHPLDNENLNFSVDYEGAEGKKVRWDLPRVHLFRKHADKLDYADWRYFTGTILDSLYQVTDAFEALDYQPYINRHMDFFLDKRPVIARERQTYGQLHSPFGHYFRYALLDDTGVAALPFAERLMRKYGADASRHSGDPDYKIARRAADHIMENVPRLDDGTFGRVNPVPLTVWADDMYMGTGILFRMAKAIDRPDYQAEAIKQILLINKNLLDQDAGVYWHGWFGGKQEHSSSKWGRANGWTIMAKTDALLVLDKSTKEYDALLKAFQVHARGLLKLQSTEGRWHQVLDNSETYLETSCSAMFIRAFAEGLRNGWLPRDEFAAATFRGWGAVTRQIRGTGHVEGIVKGTPIFFSDEEYNNHPTRLNDPRGLGAVLFMAASMERLRKEFDPGH